MDKRLRPAFTIVERSRGHVVVAVHDDEARRGGPRLVLHVIACGDDDGGVAWWELEDGRFARTVVMGAA